MIHVFIAERVASLSAWGLQTQQETENTGGGASAQCVIIHRAEQEKDNRAGQTELRHTPRFYRKHFTSLNAAAAASSSSAAAAAAAAAVTQWF